MVSTFKIKGRKVSAPQYFEQRQIQRLRKEKGFPFFKIAREGVKTEFLHEPEQIYRTGSIITYKDKFYSVRKITPEGILVQPLSKGEQEFGLPHKIKGKQIFISDKEVSKEVKPFAPPLIVFGIIGAKQKP